MSCIVEYSDAYRIRELIYIESTLPNISWLKSNICEEETVDIHANDSTLSKSHQEHDELDDEESYESTFYRQSQINAGKLLDILNMLCTQAKQTINKQAHLENSLRQLLTVRTMHDSMRSSSDVLNTSQRST
jgi:hypothetical protein